MDERVDRSAYDLAGRRTDRWDARLWDAGSARSNVRSVYSLSGRELLNDSVDAGWRLELLGEGGDSHLRWDAKGQLRRVEYDDSIRPVAVFESDGASERCVERLGYGGPDRALTNQCGRLIRHDDPPGSLFNSQYGLGGEVVEQSRKFLNELDLPDWPVDLKARDAFLESGDGSVSTWRFGPLGDAIEQTDAVANRQLFTQTVSGQLKSTRLQLNGQALQTLVSGIRYDAQNRIESETAGNGVITSQAFDVVDGRLRNLRADNGRLQNLSYAYDPAGNVLSIEDKAQPTRFFANQQIEPLRTFTYDTLYQLIEATGYESANQRRGPADVQSFATANELSNYTQRYEYDAGGNLQKLIHSGAQNHTRTFGTARYSNRTLLQTVDQPPTDEQIATGFDLNGNLRELQPGQSLSWDVRNQLSQVTPVQRDSGLNDSEIYRYDAAGMRVRKVRAAQAKAAVHLSEVRYLPGLEVRTNSATGEVLHVVTATAGRSAIRVLHWRAGKPAGLDNDQIRYSLTDHLGSTTLELAADAQLISQETYYPYGETAWFATCSEIEAGYKTVRYSGKERDATGLYHYGLRYYSPWLMRWINPDPAGDADGTNRFQFVRANPVSADDPDGAMFRWLTDLNDPPILRLQHEGYRVRYRGVSEMLSAGETALVFGIDVALITADKLIGEELESLAAGHTQRLSGFLGLGPDATISDEFRKSVIVGYQSIRDGLHKYQHGGELRNKLNFVERASPTAIPSQAMVIPGDPQRRVFVTDLFRSRNTIANVSTLVHEVSHIALDTNDNFYYRKGNMSAELAPSEMREALLKLETHAKNNNARYREEQTYTEFGHSTFESWVVQVADFWGNYLVARPLSDDLHSTVHLYGANQGPVKKALVGGKSTVNR